MFGHPNSQVLADVFKYGFKTKNTLEHTCPNCAICKAKQNNLNKLNSHPFTELVGRINIDISSVQTPNFWLLIQDDFTGYKLSFFIKARSDLPDSMFDGFHLVKKEISLDVKCIRLDNSGENNSFHQKAQRANYNIKFEFIAPGTPQQNGS
jgi:transposase InsO family protein